MHTITPAEFLSSFEDRQLLQPSEEKFFKGILEAFQVHVDAINQALGTSSPPLTPCVPLP